MRCRFFCGNVPLTYKEASKPETVTQKKKTSGVRRSQRVKKHFDTLGRLLGRVTEFAFFARELYDSM